MYVCLGAGGRICPALPSDFPKHMHRHTQPLKCVYTYKHHTGEHTHMCTHTHAHTQLWLMVRHIRWLSIVTEMPPESIIHYLQGGRLSQGLCV